MKPITANRSNQEITFPKGEWKIYRKGIVAVDTEPVILSSPAFVAATYMNTAASRPVDAAGVDDPIECVEGFNLLIRARTTDNVNVVVTAVRWGINAKNSDASKIMPGDPVKQTKTLAATGCKDAQGLYLTKTLLVDVSGFNFAHVLATTVTSIAADHPAMIEFMVV